jgi:ribosomal protein S18 acetylase RimI-like enzyme
MSAIHHSIRLLNREDGPDYQRLRLESLQNSPFAFLSTYESEQKLHEDTFSNHLDWSYHPPHFGYFGVFMPDPTDPEEKKLVGYIQVSQTFLEKQEHIAMLNNLYISPDYRGLGLASELFEHIFQVISTHEKVERLYLSCTAKNKHALGLYKKLGFRRFAVKVRAIKWQGEYDDEIEMVKVI